MTNVIFIVPEGRSFDKIRGNIKDGVQMRCGTCHCACVCRCNMSCANCKKHIEQSFVFAHTMR